MRNQGSILSPTGLRQWPFGGRDLALAANRVIEAATANVADLANYAVTAANIQSLQDATTTYANKKESPREAVIGRKVATLSLPAAIRSVRSIFRNEIDKLMTAFKKPEPDFYNAYFTARIIVDRPATIPKKPEPPPGP